MNPEFLQIFFNQSDCFLHKNNNNKKTKLRKHVQVAEKNCENLDS